MDISWMPKNMQKNLRAKVSAISLKNLLTPLVVVVSNNVVDVKNVNVVK